MVTGRLARGSSASCKVNRWFLEGTEDNDDWLSRDYPFGESVLPETQQNSGNIPIGTATNHIEASA